jgi:hypothetical protein
MPERNTAAPFRSVVHGLTKPPHLGAREREASGTPAAHGSFSEGPKGLDGTPPLAALVQEKDLQTREGAAVLKAPLLGLDAHATQQLSVGDSARPVATPKSLAQPLKEGRLRRTSISPSTMPWRCTCRPKFSRTPARACVGSAWTLDRSSECPPLISHNCATRFLCLRSAPVHVQSRNLERRTTN